MGKARNIAVLFEAEIKQAELNTLEKFLDKLFAEVGIDVEFTKHFLDRVNDRRNKTQITVSELTALFKEVFKKFGKRIGSLSSGAEAVLRDMQSKISLPFVIELDKKKGELDLVAKTVIRKPDFKTRNKQFIVN
jgi:hypothetical protein